MMDAVDKADSARFEREEILNPRDWVMLNFIMDPLKRPKVKMKRKNLKILLTMSH